MWSISDEGACYSGESGEAIGQSGILEVGKEYIVSIEVSGRTKGKLSFDSFGIGENDIIEDGIYQFSGIATIPDLSLTALDYASQPFDGCVKFVYILETPVINIIDCADQVVYTLLGSQLTAYRSYIQAIIAWDLPNGKYRVQIQSDTLEYNSECFEMGDHKCTILLSWTNDDNGYNLDYENLGLVNKLRVNAKLWNVAPTTEREVFKFSNNTKKIIYAETDMVQDLTIREVVDYTARALGIGINHDHFYIDGEEFYSEEPNLEPNWRRSSISAPVTIKVSKKTSGLINRNCK